MIPSDFLPHELLWQQPTVTVDGHGSDTYTYTGGTVIRGWVQQQSTKEIVGGRETVATAWVLFCNQAGIGALDRFTWNGQVFEADGNPAPLSTPTGVHHAEVPLRRVTG